MEIMWALLGTTLTVQGTNSAHASTLTAGTSLLAVTVWSPRHVDGVLRARRV